MVKRGSTGRAHPTPPTQEAQAAHQHAVATEVLAVKGARKVTILDSEESAAQAARLEALVVRVVILEEKEVMAHQAQMAAMVPMARAA